MAAYPKKLREKKKGMKSLPRMSDRQLAANVAKRVGYASVNERQYYCQGCGTSQNLSKSHTFGQGRKEFIGDERNIYILCMDRCHLAVESNRFWLLVCGEELVDNMLEMDYLMGIGRLMKMRDRLENVDGFLPEWVRQKLNLLI